jgi:hypothetical protein
MCQVEGFKITGTGTGISTVVIKRSKQSEIKGKMV